MAETAQPESTPLLVNEPQPEQSTSDPSPENPTVPESRPTSSLATTTAQSASPAPTPAAETETGPAYIVYKPTSYIPPPPRTFFIIAI
jgi:hypothetical protein